MLSKNEIKSLRALHLKKNRDQAQHMLIEGERTLKDLIARHPEFVERIFFSKDFGASRLSGLLGAQSNIPRVEVDRLSLEQLATSKGPQGVVALVKYPQQALVRDGFTLVLDGIQDPGNLGTILRTAAWFGVQQVVCSLNTVDFCNPKVVQASMGAIFDLRVTYCDLISFLESNEMPVYGALLEGVSIYRTSFEQPAVLIMGNEGNGITQEVLRFVNRPVSIPKFGLGESLNVATATAIFLSNFAAQTIEIE